MYPYTAFANVYTGGAGYIGSHSVIALVESGYDVVVADNFSNSSVKVFGRLFKILGKPVPYREVDLNNYEQTLKLFKDFKFDGVIHFAAKKSVGESVSHPLDYYQNNLLSMINVLRSMNETGCKNIVFSSSATVYQESEIPLTEDMPLGASNPYGQTKFMSEQILKDVCVSTKDMKASLLRYFNPVGNHETGLIGESPAMPNNLMPYIQQVAVGRKECLTVFGNDYNTRDGTGVRDYLHVVDLANAHLKAIDYLLNPSTPFGCHVHNLGGGQGTSVLELVHQFEDACGTPIKHTIGARRPGDLGSVIANPSKAEKELGWKAMRDTGIACKDAWLWQSSHPNGCEDFSDYEQDSV